MSVPMFDTASTFPAWTPLPRDFYRRDALCLARALLGTILVHRSPEGLVAARIVEVEAYRGVGDRAAHSWNGRRTRRNETMWGPEGHLYVYFIYGMHWCANVVCAGEGVPEAVLLRAAEPVAGLEVMRRRRGRKVRDAHLLRGPACLCRALGLDGRHDGADLCGAGLFLAGGTPVPARQVRCTPRVGVARPEDLLPDRDRPRVVVDDQRPAAGHRSPRAAAAWRIPTSTSRSPRTRKKPTSGSRSP